MVTDRNTTPTTKKCWRLLATVAVTTIVTSKDQTSRFFNVYAFCPPVVRHSRTVRNQVNWRTKQFAKDNNDDKEDAGNAGMAEAFRQLESLDSLGNEKETTEDGGVSLPDGIEKVDLSRVGLPTDDTTSKDAETSSPEKEVQMYTDMVKDLEDQSEDQLYSDVLKDMGGDSATTPKSAPSSPAAPSPKIDLNGDTEEFMNQALKEAMSEVKINNPKISKSILDDQEIMKEIEEIFDRGNEKLMESLEEIRQEQRQLAQASANKNADTAQAAMEADARRLEQAEASMEAMLKRVNKESADVAKAVEDLKAAQAEVDQDFLVKLKAGGPIKQGTFIGLVLFSLRSIFDTIAALGGNGDMMTPALIQAGIAVACAAVFLLV